MVNMQSGSVLQRSKRDSGMELLKIFGMLMIIFGHIIRTLRLKSAAVPYSDYVIDTAAATESVRVLMLHIMSYSGQFGNWMFFFCSAWFLVDSKESRKNKITFMVMDIWLVSVIILAVSLIVNRDLISNKAIMQSLFPTISLNNWYMTAYMLLYAAHPFLNMIIEKLPQNRLFALSATLMVLYTGINFIKETFFSSRVINYISGLSLLIYIIHENVIVRTCLRAFIWHYVYNRFGFDHLFLIIFIYTVALFAASMAAAALYRLTLERFVVKAADKATPLLSKAYHKIEDKAMKKK